MGKGKQLSLMILKPSQWTDDAKRKVVLAS